MLPYRRWTDIDLWTKPWIPWISTTDLRAAFNPNGVVNSRIEVVADLFHPDSCCWNVDLLNSLFRNDVVYQILRIIPLLEPHSDKLFWKPSGSGIFTIKSAYLEDQRNRFKAISPVWTKLWNSKIHHRLKFLLWRIASNCMPTADKPYFRGGDNGGLCPLCFTEVETSLHLFISCPAARSIWFNSLYPFRVDALHLESCLDFIDWILCKSASSIRNNFIMFATCALDHLWKARNNKLFKNIHFELGVALSCISKAFSEFKQVNHPSLDPLPL